MFNQKYIDHLEAENKRKDERILLLETRLFEIFDTKVFSRLPERLARPEAAQTDKSGKQDFVTDQPSDALSAAEADAWNKSKPKVINTEMN